MTSATEPYAPGDQPTARTRAPVATTDRDADRPDGVYWLVTYNSNNPNAAGLGQDLGLDQVGIRRDAIILYQWQLGAFPVEGPHRMLRDAAWLTRHLAKVRQDVAHWVRPGFTGVVVIDYESWDLTWDETLNRASPQAWDARDRDYKDDWREALRATAAGRVAGMSDKAFEAYAKETYEAATKRIYLETLAAAKAVRPEAKWGYFQYPQRYYGSSKTPAGTIGYPSPEAGSVATKINDGLAWLFEAVDVVVPAPYAPRITASDAEAKALKLARKDSHAPDIAERYYRSNIREAVRVARGKPVLPILRLRYYQDNTTWLRTPDVEIPLAMAKEEGAAGVMLWENVRTPAGDAELRTFADTILKPAVVHSAWMRAPRSP